jgi:hypothetical protein
MEKGQDAGARGAAPSTSGAEGGSGRSAQEYSLNNILASRQNASASDLSSAAKNVVGSPCFKQSFLWAGAVALLFAGHRWKQGGTLLRSTNDGVLAWMGTFASQWYLCRRDEHDRRLALRAFYASQQRLQAGTDLRAASSEQLALAHADVNREADVTSAANGSISSGSSGSGAAQPAWQQELARLTQYDLPTVIEGGRKSVPLDR